MVTSFNYIAYTDDTDSPPPPHHKKYEKVNKKV